MTRPGVVERVVDDGGGREIDVAAICCEASGGGRQPADTSPPHRAHVPSALRGKQQKAIGSFPLRAPDKDTSRLFLVYSHMACRFINA